MTHTNLFHFWKYWASKEDSGESFISKMPNDFLACEKIGENCHCENFNPKIY